MTPTLQEQFAQEDAEIAKADGHPKPVQKADLEKAAIMPFRIGVVVLYIIAFAGVGYVAFQGTTRAISFLKGNAPAVVVNTFTPLSNQVAATTAPVPHNPSQKVVSQQNIIRVSNSNPKNPNPQNLAEKNQVSPDSNCPDYLGDQFACVPSPIN